MHIAVVEVSAVIGETLRMDENISVQEVGSVREVFLYLCWGAVGVCSEWVVVISRVMQRLRMA